MLEMQHFSRSDPPGNSSKSKGRTSSSSRLSVCDCTSVRCRVLGSPLAVASIGDSGVIALQLRASGAGLRLSGFLLQPWSLDPEGHRGPVVFEKPVHPLCTRRPDSKGSRQGILPCGRGDSRGGGDRQAVPAIATADRAWPALHRRDGCLLVFLFAGWLGAEVL